MLSAGPCHKPANAASAAQGSKEIDMMNFVSVRVIASDVSRLVEFYEAVTGLSATRYTEDFAELATPGGVLAIGSERTVALFGPGSARPADNHSCILEFRVEDVDKEYARLQNVITEVVQKPTTMPWGNRSLLFRDPDGNLINFFTPVSAAAIQKFNR
jgi:predicted enzyme related to lactoylglutathione lyase